MRAQQQVQINAASATGAQIPSQPEPLPGQEGQ